MNPQRIIALLGRKDRPTDAVEEYCRLLGQALTIHGFALEVRRVPWDEHGWGSSLRALQLQAESWRGVWVLVQYTALAWSRRGFPRRLLAALRILHHAGARIVTVYHDVVPFAGTRAIDRLRRAYQLRVMRAAQRLSDKAVVTVAADGVFWLERAANAVFVTVGANLAMPAAPQNHEELHRPPTVGVFGITGGVAGERETRDIVATVREASVHLGPLRLLAFGRHAELRESALREGLRGSAVELHVEGVVADSNLPERFAALDVLLFVRGQISSRRSSAIAGIACGVPIIAFRGEETAPPITDAGVLLLNEEDSDDTRHRNLAEAVVRLCKDQGLRAELLRRNRIAYEESFSWSAIAKRYSEFLQAAVQERADF